jgi:hypothetical protein
MTEAAADAAGITLQPAAAGDAMAIRAVFDAAVRAGWTYLGDLAAGPMFTPQDWDQLVADHLPPKVLLVAVSEPDGIVGYTAVHRVQTASRTSAARGCASCGSSNSCRRALARGGHRPADRGA